MCLDVKNVTCYNSDKEGELTIPPKDIKAAMAKRSRELAKQAKRKEKEERRALRKADKTNPQSDEEDPDLAGIIPGPQPPLMDSE